MIFDSKIRLTIRSQSGVSSSALWAIQPQSVARDSTTPVAGEDVFEAVERQVVAILARDRLGQEPRAGQPLVDRLGGLVREGDVLLAVAAGIAKSGVDDDEERRRHVLQLRAGLFADLGASVSAVR